MSISAANIDLFLLVFMRMSGMTLFNPVFGRKNIPVMVKAGLSLVLALMAVSTLDASKLHINGFVQLFGCCILELLFGYAVGVLMQGLFSVVLLAGESIDLQMGFSMANIYDPASQVSMPIVGSIFNALLILTFFASNAYLVFFRLISDSFGAIPPGTIVLTPKSLEFVAKMGGDIFELGLRLALPIIAVEFVTQIAMGILMRAVPQINIFTVGIQIQLFVGIALLLILMPVIITLLTRLNDYTVEKCVELVKLLIPARSG